MSAPLPRHRVSLNYRGFVLEENDRDGIVTIWQPVQGGRKIVAQYGKQNGTKVDRLNAWDDSQEYADATFRDIRPAYRPMRLAESIRKEIS